MSEAETKLYNIIKEFKEKIEIDNIILISKEKEEVIINFVKEKCDTEVINVAIKDTIVPFSSLLLDKIYNNKNAKFTPNLIIIKGQKDILLIKLIKDKYILIFFTPNNKSLKKNIDNIEKLNNKIINIL